MNRSVLLVTPYFAPQTHAAMFRVHKLAKYLPRYGWKPVVLTTDTNYLYNENSALLDELPPEVEIHRARFVEPTLRGVRMALGGEDRTFAALKDKGHFRAATGGENEVAAAKPSFSKRAYHRFLKRVAQRPDPYWTWRGPAIQMARQLIREKNISVVYTTTRPYTTLQVGEALQEITGCKWVADLRDPGTYSQRTDSAGEAVFLKQRRIEGRALWKADAVTGLSSVYAHIFNDLYGPGLFDRIRFIPTGLDEALIPPACEMERGHLVFSGEYLPEYGNAFWRILRGALDAEPSLQEILTVSVIGHEQMNRVRITPHLDQYYLADHVRFRDHIPQQELYCQLAKAHAGILIPGQHSHWWTNFAKMVDYIALQKPVLALVPNPSEARKELSRAGLGVFLDGSVEGAARTLAAFLRGDREVRANVGVSEEYLASAQVEAFAKVFNSLICQ